MPLLFFPQVFAQSNKNDGEDCEPTKMFECRSKCCAPLKDPTTNKWVIDPNDGEIAYKCQ